MGQVKIAILLPIARLDRYGYQHFYRTILKNHCAFADRVFVLSTSRYNPPELFRGYSNIELVSNYGTWVDIENGQEKYNIEKINGTIAQCEALIKHQRYDVCLNIHVNQYVPRSAFEPLRAVCTEIVQKNKPFAWLYKKYQLRDLLFDADCRLPWILNMTSDQPYRFGADSLINTSTGECIMVEYGDFRKYNNQAIVDVLGEHTIADAKEKYEYTIQEQRKLNGTYDPADSSNLKFDEKTYIQYHLGKINRKTASRQDLDALGTEILRQSRSDFVSSVFRSSYAPIQRGWLSRLKQFLIAKMR